MRQTLNQIIQFARLPKRTESSFASKYRTRRIEDEVAELANRKDVLVRSHKMQHGRIDHGISDQGVVTAKPKQGGKDGGVRIA